MVTTLTGNLNTYSKILLFSVYYFTIRLLPSLHVLISKHLTEKVKHKHMKNCIKDKIRDVHFQQR